MTLWRAARSMFGGLLLFASGLAAPEAAFAHGDDAPAERLPVLGPAPGFTLTNASGAPLSLADLKGKVVAVSFIFTNCPDFCPLLTDKMVDIQQELGEAFGREVYFVSITVDPEVDRPEVLKAYAEMMGADRTGWAFVTGTQAEIHTVARQYGVFIEKRADGDVDHNLFTSLIDRTGTLRVQYMGQRFDPDEFLHDLRDLAREGREP